MVIMRWYEFNLLFVFERQYVGKHLLANNQSIILDYFKFRPLSQILPHPHC